MMGKRTVLWGLAGIAAVLAAVALLGLAPQAAAQDDSLKSYTTSSGIAFKYPESWIVTENMDGDYTLIELDNSPSADEKELDSLLDPGEAKIGVYMAPASQMYADLGLSADAYPLEVLNLLLDPSEFSFGPMYEVTIGGASWGRADGSASDNRFDFVALAGQLADGTAVIVQANTTWGEIAAHESIILAICDSFTASASVTIGDLALGSGDTLPQEYEDPDGVITLNYPDGWIVEKYFGIIFIATSQAALEGDMTALGTGDLQINLMAGTPGEVGIPEAGTAFEVGQAMMAEAAADPEVSSTSGPNALDGFQYDAAGMTVSQGNVDIMAIIILADERHSAMLLAGAPQGELSQHEETILAIAQSIQFVDAGGGVAEETTETTTSQPADNAVNWQTETVSLSADNFYITANGQTFTADVDNVSVGGDPGSDTYTTLEVEWEEHGVPMRLYMYFESDGSIWQAYEIRIYDGSPNGEWIYYENPSFTTPLGQAYQVMFFSRDNNGNVLYFDNLRVQAFTAGEAGTVTPTEEPAPTPETVTGPPPLTGPADCRNVAVSIRDYSSEYSEGYGPGFLLDNNPETGWSSAGYGETEYVVINLAGVQTVYGVLFNSYSPSSGYETDSIKDFTIRTMTTSGEQKVVFEGRAAFQQGYQSYTFEPVETDYLEFDFYSTHGGSYFEAADIMICGMPQTTTTAGQEIRQWASAAVATSQYSDTDWSAAQATDAPDTPLCGDIGTAWASSTATGIDELVVLFETPVVPTQINIYQTYNPGAISSITLLLANVGDGPPVPNSADPGTSCPGIFTVNIPHGFTNGTPIEGIAILVDQSNHTGWNEIDAVELVGYVP